MPRVSGWFVRASLVYLGLGFTLGAVLLVNKGFALDLALGRLIPAHIELLLVGWIVQLVMGVALWIFPRFGLRPTTEGRVGLAWIAFGLLNLGVVEAAAAPLIGNGVGSVLPLIGRLIEITAAIVFVCEVRGRVRGSGLSGV